MASSRLILHERYRIQVLQKVAYGIVVIALMLERFAGTISCPCDVENAACEMLADSCGIVPLGRTSCRGANAEPDRWLGTVTLVLSPVFDGTDIMDWRCRRTAGENRHVACRVPQLRALVDRAMRLIPLGLS